MNLFERWMSARIWQGESRRHGRALQTVLREWRPEASGDLPVDPSGRPAPGPSWVRDDELLRGILACLWHGATERDLAAWLQRPLNQRHDAGATPDELHDLACRLVEAYEQDLGRG